MKLTIFGGSGRTGKLLVAQALAAGHQVTAYVRNPARLDITNNRLRVVQGDLRNASRIEEVVSAADAVISVLAPGNKQATCEISNGMSIILAAMNKCGIRRLVVSAGASVRIPQDRPRLTDRIITVLLRLIARSVYDDMLAAIGKVEESGLDWTVVRAPMLTNGPATGNPKVGYLGKGVGTRLSRADLAAFILKAAAEGTYVRDHPVISN